MANPTLHHGSSGGMWKEQRILERGKTLLFPIIKTFKENKHKLQTQLGSGKFIKTKTEETDSLYYTMDQKCENITLKFEEFQKQYQAH